MQISHVEPLENRRYLAVTALFVQPLHLLTILGDNHANTIAVGRNAAGSIRINNGTVPIIGGSPTVANTTSILILSLGGNDAISLDETNGPLPRSIMFGDGGNDILTGASANDELYGGPGADILTGGQGNDRLFGNQGNDILSGNAGDDLLDGGDGNDQAEGNQGVDTVLLGAGNDLFKWTGGDGIDIVEGQAGTDTLFFNGSDAPERIFFSQNGPRLEVSYEPAHEVFPDAEINLDDVEIVNLIARGGQDQVILNDLSTTDLTDFHIELANPTGGDELEIQDWVNVTGTTGDDNIRIAGDGGNYRVTGLKAAVSVTSSETNDLLSINALEGNDRIDASALAAGTAWLNLLGHYGDDVLIGSAGDDVIIGGPGADVALMRAGDDMFIWNMGDESDVVEGQAGADIITFGGILNETIDLSAHGSRLRLLHSFPGQLDDLLDIDGVEKLELLLLSGDNHITINDLSATDLTELRIAQQLLPGAGGLIDHITTNTANSDDVLQIQGSDHKLIISGLSTFIFIEDYEGARYDLTINTLAGDDIVDAAPLAAGVTTLIVNAGDGNDILIGSAGNDILLGGNGDDILLGGPGLDVLDGGSGDNVIIQD